MTSVPKDRRVRVSMRLHVRGISIVLGLVLLHCLAASASAQGRRAPPRADVVRRLARSTVEIHAEGAIGSGLVVGDERWIATTYCAVAEVLRAHPWGDAWVDVTFSSGTRRRARVLRADVGHDLVLLEVTGRVPVPPLPLAPGPPPALGQRVMAFGSVHGLTGTLSEGTMSEPSAGSRVHAPLVTDLLRHDALVAPGSAGSPVVDVRGEVVGVSVANDRLDPRMAFAVPVAYLRDFVLAVRVARAGGLAALGPPGLDDLGIRGEDDMGGVHVMHVEPGSVADRMGLVGADQPMEVGVSRSGVPIGHVIMEVDGQPTPTVAELRRVLATLTRGTHVRATVRASPDPRARPTAIELVLDLPP